ncbi:FRG domain-containing protein [Brucella anthropi]|uniref:FRG domain-containing protein n=1 Tax=Brucella anthropi TaxID=529 RepID=UPI002673B948|nr:FRG domain-containing protein [Brucella anthropi]WKT93791.1 FRG domain-containing protein [Brucella anthropi]
MQKLRLTGRTLAAYFDLIEKQAGSYRNLFRGQLDESWPLIPSLYRTTPNVMGAPAKEAFDDFEMRCLQHFFREGHPYLPTLQRGYANDRIIAQHFGVPTRLLDWSRDPLVALYFAVEQSQALVDAAVYMLTPNATISPDAIRLDNPQYPAIAVVPPAIDRRIPAQKSVFTIHPYGDPTKPFEPLDNRQEIGATYGGTDGTIQAFVKIIIPAHVTTTLRHALLNAGVDRRNLFPGLDGVGQDTATRAKLGYLV